MVKFFEENKRVREACHYMEESFREAADAMWEQANKIDKLKTENAKLKRENDRLKANVDTDYMTKPQPCTVKFQDADAFDWTAKLIEETDEAVHEARIVRNLTRANDEKLNQHLQLARKRLAEELTDVIHVCVSWLDAEGWDEEARGELHRLVNEKNKKRGYF